MAGPGLEKNKPRRRESFWSEHSEDWKGQDAHPSGRTSLSQVSGACCPHQGLTLPWKPVKAMPLVSFAVLLPRDQVLGLILNLSYGGRK